MKLIKFKHDEQYELYFLKEDGLSMGMCPISGGEVLKAVEEYISVYWNEVESETWTTKKKKR